MKRDVTNHINDFWIEQNYGCTFPFTVQKGIVKAFHGIGEGSDTSDAKFGRALIKKFVGKHVSEVYKQLMLMPGIRIKNNFVIAAFNKKGDNHIRNWRNQPESWKEELVKQKVHLDWLLNNTPKDTSGNGGIPYYDQISLCREFINELKGRILNFGKSESYLKAKAEYNKMLEPIEKEHGIKFSYKNVVHIILN